MRRLPASLITFSTSVALPLSRPSEMRMIALGAGKSVLAPPFPGAAAAAGVRPALLRGLHLLDGELRAGGQGRHRREKRQEASPEVHLHVGPYSRFSRIARHLNSNSMSPSLMMSLSIRSCFCTFSSLTKVPFELSRSAIWKSPPSYRTVACLREIFLSVSTMSQSAAVPSTFFPTRRRKSSPLCWPLSATIQPHTSRLLSWDPRPFSPPLSWMLSMAVPWPADGIGMAETPPPAAIIACCISRQYGQVSQLGCITWPFGQILPCCLSFFRNGRMRSTMARNDTKGLSLTRVGRTRAGTC